jgi:hypothetical protein
MEYIIRAYNRLGRHAPFNWSYVIRYLNNTDEGIVNCGYGTIDKAQRFHRRKDARMAANKLLTRKVEEYMRPIIKVVIEKYP